jgi:ABC-type transport system involved in multi-copper enzyme maturation permease subunit
VSATQAEQSPKPFLGDRLQENPIVLKELRGRMRGGRAYILISIYLILLGGLVGMIYLGHAAAQNSPGSGISSQSLGKTIFGAATGLELMMIIFIAPALTSGAISAEREHQTYDLLRTTLLSPRSLVIGKLTSALSFLLLLLVVAFPLQSLAYLSGGVSLEELFIAFLLLIVTAIAFSAAGLFVSSFTRRTLASTVISYITANLAVFGIPIVVYIAIAFTSSFIFSGGLNISASQQAILEVILIIGGWFFVSTNPVAAAIGTEVILMQQQNALYMNIPLSNGTNVLVIAPWIGYVVFYLLLSALLIWWSIRIVHRVDR